MVPGIYDMVIFRGGTFTVDLTASDTDGPINFSETYTSAELKIYRAWLTNTDEMPAEELYELSTANGLIIIAGTTITLYIPATMTIGLPFIGGVYRLKLVVDGMDPIADFLLKGTVTVES